METPCDCQWILISELIGELYQKITSERIKEIYGTKNKDKNELNERSRWFFYFHWTT